MNADGNGNGNGQLRSNGASRLRCVRVQLAHTDGRICNTFVSKHMADKLMRIMELHDGAPLRVSTNAKGVITAVLNGQPQTRHQARHRFLLPVDPLSFEPHISDEWDEWIDKWTDDSVWLLFFGSEGTGKDTLCKLLIERIMANVGADLVDVFGLPPEESDRYVGHVETKGKEFAEAIAQSKADGKTTIVYVSELAQHFGRGDFTSSWQKQWEAFFRGLIDGPKDFQADYFLATTNTLSGMGGPTISRFIPVPVKMSDEMAAGMLERHWPAEVSDRSLVEYVLDRLSHETIAEGIRTSCNTLLWKAHDFSGFNGRFIAHLCADVRRNVKHRLNADADFTPDKAFLDKILKDHLTAAIIAPVVEAAGTRTLRDFLITPPSPTDPVVEVKAVLQWCDESTYLV